MTMLGDVRMYGRFAVGLRRFLRHQLTREEAERIVAARLAQRDANFLRLLERGIYGYPHSPYLELLRRERISLADVRALVARRGLEHALSVLRDAGVYVSFEDFKRNNHRFDNPHLKRMYEVRSSGSSGGVGTRVTHDLDHLADRAPHDLLGCLTHGVLGAPIVFWRPVLPAGSGINGVLAYARIGNPPVRWFTPVTPDDLRSSTKYRIATTAIIAAGRALGTRLPFPEPAPLAEAVRVARAVAQLRDEHGRCLFRSSVSLALRACLAATAEKIDLSQVTVIAGGEPPTDSKVAGITASGAHYVPSYFFAECGAVGWGCARPRAVNDMHFFEDSLALVQRPRTLPGTNTVANTFYFTTLLAAAPKLMLNVETDDFGAVEERSCGCPLEAYGLRRHIVGVQSFSKLTGEGVTLVGSDMVQILEEVLPRRFGGSPLDYQLVQGEDARGLTRLALVISPRIELRDEREPIRVLLEELARRGGAADLARGIWQQADTFRVERAEPHVSSAGKQMPFRVTSRKRVGVS
jgi:hypothetical protein